ncbi:MAG TPA: IPT/TIG domain-containing protein [Candidatus Solibacter sp.]|jgi:hypothetical protein|nr:IPT/TIG domain-containing protein [Candidatus Solibacter sp.]
MRLTRIVALLMSAAAVLPSVVLVTAVMASVDTPCPANNGRIVNSGTASYSNCTISGNSAAAGGGIVNTGTLTLTNVTVKSNTAAGDGGGIWNSGDLTLNNVVLEGNISGGNGGAIFNQGPLHVHAVNITELVSGSKFNLQFFPNTATNNGGGLWTDHPVDGTSLTADFSGAGGDGGGIWSSSTLTLTSLDVEENGATNGGGVWTSGETSIVTASLAFNGARQDGGAVWSSGSFRMIQAAVASNHAAGSGGGIYSGAGVLALNGDSLWSNGAGANGGGLSVAGLLQGTTLTPNPMRVAASAKTAEPRAPAQAAAPNLTLSENHAGGAGGAIFDSGNVDLLNATIANNTAQGVGGGVAINHGLFDLQSTLLSRNLPANCSNIGGSIAELGGVNSANLDTGTTCEDGGSHPSDKVNVADPKLDFLADWGGVRVPTSQGGQPGLAVNAPLFGSPAIDGVPAGGGCQAPGLAVDARGVARPQAALCDIGAAECIADAPSITSASPSAGPSKGGTLVTITGTGFNQPFTGLSVLIGGAPVAMFTTPPNQIVLTTPPGSGNELITVQTCYASSSVAFAFVDLPAAGALLVLPHPRQPWLWLVVLCLPMAAAGRYAWLLRRRRRLPVVPEGPSAILRE